MINNSIEYLECGKLLYMTVNDEPSLLFGSFQAVGESH